MKRTKKMEYQPLVYGTLCEGRCRADPWLARKLAETAGDSVLLPFVVERRHLKNVVLTMKLMDVVGLAVEDGHRRAITRHLPKLHASARAAGSADTIMRQGRSFTGYDSTALALMEWLSSLGIRKGTALLTGRGKDLEVIAKALKGRGFRVNRAGSPGKLPKHDLIVAGGSAARPTRGCAAPRLTARELTKKARLLRVELLTEPVKIK